MLPWDRIRMIVSTLRFEKEKEKKNQKPKKEGDEKGLFARSIVVAITIRVAALFCILLNDASSSEQRLAHDGEVGLQS